MTTAVRRHDLPGRGPWPVSPYPGLGYYQAEDRPLLAGRDRDVQWFGDLLSHPDARVVMLHGMTGVGKSSFLRAGLIPALDEVGGYHFLKRQDEGITEALFIRCSATPVDQLADHVFRFASAPLPVDGPRGRTEIDLSDALLGRTALADYMAAAREPGGLVESLSRITRRLPRTLVLVVDQAEEVFTLNAGEESWQNRAIFFDLLRDLQAVALDLRLIVTFRTEYHGRLYDAVSLGGSSGDALKSYHLEDLDRAALIEAVRRPTRRDDVNGFGVPYDVYRFDFEPGLPERIADDILAQRFQGAAGPVVQLVCRGLHESLPADERERRITLDQYETAKGVEGQIVRHLERAVMLLLGEFPWLGDLNTVKAQLKAFLTEFVQKEPDGTLVARVHDRAWAGSRLRTLLSRLPDDADRIGAVLAVIESPQLLVLRQVRRVDARGKETIGLAIGHDCLALGLLGWEIPLSTAERQEKAINDALWTLLGLGVLGAMMVGVIVGIYKVVQEPVHVDVGEVIGTIGIALVAIVLIRINTKYQLTKAIKRSANLRRFLIRVFLSLRLVRDRSLLEE